MYLTQNSFQKLYKKRSIVPRVHGRWNALSVDTNKSSQLICQVRLICPCQQAQWLLEFRAFLQHRMLSCNYLSRRVAATIQIHCKIFSANSLFLIIHDTNNHIKETIQWQAAIEETTKSKSSNFNIVFCLLIIYKFRKIKIRPKIRDFPLVF